MTTDVLCEQASIVTEYIVKTYTDYPLDELEKVAPNGDLGYSDRVQDIFNNVLDLIDLRQL